MPNYIEERISWDTYFMLLAKVASLRSTCTRSRKVGCVIVRDNQVLSTGYNGSPNGYPNCTENGCNVKFMESKNVESKYDYCFASHAEANAVSMAAKRGIGLENSTIYTTLSPCLTCAKTLIMAGVKDVVYEYEYTSSDSIRDDFWNDFIRLGLKKRKYIIPPVNFDFNQITSKRKEER